MFGLLFCLGGLWVAITLLPRRRVPTTPLPAGAPPVAAAPAGPAQLDAVQAAFRRWRLVGWWMLSAGVGGGLGGNLAAPLPWPAFWACGFALAAGMLCMQVIGGNAETPVGTALRQRALVNSLVLAVVVAVTWWQAGRAEKRQDPAWAMIPWGEVAYVRGVVRDASYIKERLEEGQFVGVKPADMPEATAGTHWKVQSLVQSDKRPGLTASDKGKPVITVAGLHDLRAGYTIQAVAQKPEEDTKGWLSKSAFTPEAWAALKGVVDRQQLADGRRWPGHWNDPTTGRLMPYRFYERTGDKSKSWVRVANPRVQVGPEGERIMDLSLYESHEDIVAEVKAKATALSRPYRGGRAPLKGVNRF